MRLVLSKLTDRDCAEAVRDDEEMIRAYRWPWHNDDFWASLELFIGADEMLRIFDSHRLPFPIERCAEQITAGEKVPAAFIAVAIETTEGPIPKPVRDYAAGLIDGSVSDLHGPTVRRWTFQGLLDDLWQAVCAARVRRLAERLKRLRVRAAHRKALHHVAKRIGVSEAKMQKWLYARRS